MKRKGFTLVEMLAVVGVVAVLVILVLPNALKNYREGKKTAFIDEAKTVYTKATDTYVTERTKGNRIGYISNTDDVGKSLNLSNEKNLQYNVMLDPKGKVTSFVLVNNEFCIVGSGDFLDKYSIDDIIDLTDLNGKEMDPELVAKCTFDTFAAGTELYVLLHTDNRTTAHNPTAITLKYGEGWYKGQSTRNSLTIDDGFYVIDNIPTRKNYYYAGTKTADGVEVIDCSGKVRIDNNGNGIFDPSDKSNRKTDATANMIKKYYTIVFNYNEGSGNIGSVKCDYDTTCNVPTTVPTRTGYNFIGWKFGSETYQPGEAMDVITDDNEDSNSSFKFSNSNICNGGDQTIQNDKTFMAQWQGRPYNIAYDCNGITCPTLPTTAKYDELVTIANPSRTGYTFTGWTITNHNATTAKMGTDPDVTKLNTSISGTPKNLYYKNLTDIENHTVNYKANWTVNKYTITYVLNGGTNPTDAWTEYTVEDDYKLPIPTRTGYSFVGWYTASDFSGSPVTKIESPTTGNKTFYAKWTYGIYTITLKNNNATTAGTSKIYEKYTQGWYSDSSANTSIDKITSPKRNNYTFAGYYDGSAQIIDKSGNIKASNTKYSADKSLDTKWCNNCNANDHGTCTLSINATTGACSYTTSCSTGYTLGNNGKYNYTCTVNEYTITYYLNNGTNPSGVKNKYTVEDEYTLPTPTRVGYTFGGWYTSSDFSGTAVTKIAKGSTGNKKFYAKWNYGIFTITLNNKDATTNGTGAIYEQYTQSWHSSSSVSNSNKITSITKPQRTNYTFAGYYDSGAVVDKDGNIKAANNKYTADKTLAPTWCRSCVSVSNGTCTLSINATTGACTYTTNCNNNYTLKSGSGTYDPKCCRNCADVSHGTCTLSYDSGCKYSTTCDTGYSVNNNGQYNATCTATSYTITYELNGGTNPSNAKTSYTIEDEYTLPTPTKTNYNFGGWYTSSDFSGTAVTRIAKGSTGNKTFYAKWTQNCPTVTCPTGPDLRPNGFMYAPTYSGNTGSHGVTISGGTVTCKIYSTHPDDATKEATATTYCGVYDSGDWTAEVTPSASGCPTTTCHWTTAYASKEGEWDFCKADYWPNCATSLGGWDKCVGRCGCYTSNCKWDFR